MDDEPKLSQEEYKELESLLKTGDPYSIFGLNYQDGKNEIEKRYNELISSGKGIMNENEIQAIENAYKLLSNQSYRQIYDKYIIQLELNQKKLGDSFEKIRMAIISIALRSLSIPSQMIARISNSPLSVNQLHSDYSLKSRIQNTGDIMSSIYKEKGIKGFYRGFLLSVLTFPIEFLRVVNLEIFRKLIESGGSGKKSSNDFQNRFIEILDDLTYLVTSYPVKFIFDCLIISPFSVSTIQVIKDVVLGNKSGSEVSQYAFKNLYYGAIYSIPLYLLSQSIRKLVNYGIDKIKIATIQEEEVDGQQVSKSSSPLVKYAGKLLTNDITTSIIKSVLCCPLYVLISHYPTQMVASYLSGLPLPKAVNPINLAITIYKHNGIGYFYKGLLPLTAFRFFDTKLRIYSNEPVNHEMIFE